MAALSSRRDAVLREMGLGPLWRLRARTDVAHAQEARQAQEAPARVAAGDGQGDGDRPNRPQWAPPTSHALAPAVRPSATPTGPRTVPRRPDASSVPEAAPAGVSAAARAARIARLDWDELEADIRACRACALCAQRQQAVPGTGDRKAAWLFVGEGPGREEDVRGEAFVGPAGRLLDNMLAAIGLQRTENVYIANAVKCRPPHNRIPEAAEIAACRPYLQRQIELLAPRLIFVMGRPAAHSLLDRAVNISASRGRRIEHEGQTLVISYHPAYLLRNPHDKDKAWADLCLARELMDKLAD